ncbi:MAG: TatD family hydrolase [Gammaproteobacteria bacterium]
MSPRLIDVGANLTHDSFDRDRSEVIARAQIAGICHMVVTGADVESSRQALELCRQYPKLLSCTAGTHPHQASGFDTESTPMQLQDLLRQPEAVAVGECGLDYFRNFSPHPDQVLAFESQLELAAQIGKPVFMHQRDAHRDFIRILRHYRDRISAGIVHCFTGIGEELSEYLDLDLYVGITGWICDERRGAHLRELVSQIPADRIMIETDAPYLLPRDMKPSPKDRRNEPSYLPHILHSIAVHTSRTPEQIATETTANAIRFFDLQITQPIE